MKAKIFGVLVVLAVLAGGIIFYWQATGPVSDQIVGNTQNTNTSAPAVRDQLPPSGATIGAEASVIVSDLITAAAEDAATYTADDENFLLDDTSDLDAIGQAITIE